ncbi:MAG: hypothetical protein AAF490_02145 [Chloroflexota bacterium]
MTDSLQLIGFLIVCLLFIFGIFWLYDTVKRRLFFKIKERKLNRLLDGRRLEDVLEEAPYDFAHFQGEDGYRLIDTSVKDGFVGFASTPLDAHIWIVEQYLSEPKM